MPDVLLEAPRTRHRFRNFLIGCSLVLAVLIALVWFAPAIVATTSLKQSVLAMATDGLNGTVEVGELSLGWFSPVEIHAVTVTDSRGKPAIQVAKISTSKSLLALALDHADVGLVTIEQPVVNLICEPGTTNIEQIIANFLKDDGSPMKPVRTGIVLQVVQGRVNLTEAGHTSESVLELPEATITMPSSRAEPITVIAAVTTPDAVAPGTLNAELSVGTTTTAKIKSDRLALGNLEPLVRRFVPDTNIAGQLTSDVNATLDSASPDKSKLAIDGNATVVNLDVAGPMFGADRVKMQSLAVSPCKLTYANNEVQIEQADVRCDAGTLAVAGTVNLAEKPTNDRSWALLLSQPGMKLDADVDVAKLSAIVPKLLRLKPGTELREGRLTAKLESKASATGTDWQGSVVTTSLKGSRDGKPLVWELPLQIVFDGQLRADFLPVFHKLECKADFIGLAGRGSVESFILMANIDLDRLGARLADFVDLGNTKIAGFAEVTVKNEPRAGGGFQANAAVKVTNLQFTDSTGRGLAEPELKINATVTGLFDPNGPIRIDAADATVTAGVDQFTAKLLEPVANAREVRSGKLSATLNGELARWRTRVGAFSLPVYGEGRGGVSGSTPLNPPADGGRQDKQAWQISGAGPLEATVTVNEDGITLDRVTGLLTNVRFVGEGVELNEPKLKVETGARWTRKTGYLDLTHIVVHCDTIVATAPRIEVRPVAGGYTFQTILDVTANLNRVQRLLKLQSDPRDADAINGQAIGLLSVGNVGTAILFDGDFKVDNFMYGSPAKPTWSEPWVKIHATGGYDADAVRFQTLRVERDGFSLDGKGAFAKISTSQELDLEGILAYDLVKLEPTLKQYLGKGSSATGKDARPFRLAGSLADGGKQSFSLSVYGEGRGGVGGSTPLNPPADGGRQDKQAFALASRGEKPTNEKPTNDRSWAYSGITGNAGLSWQQIKAYGFEVGPSELKAGLERGVVTMNAIEANFGGGKVRVEPKLDLNTKGYDVTLAKGKIIDQAKLTPAACANAIGYALPAFANAAQADGLISFDLEDNTIPLLDPEEGTLRGKLTLHNVSVSPGPVVTEIATLLGAKQLNHTLAKDQVVPIKLENGRVYHENFDITIGQTVVRSSGSVGLDNTVSLTMDMPVPVKVLDQLLGNNPRIRDIVSKQRIKVPVTGTLAKPVLDHRSIEANMQAMIRNAAKDAITNTAGEAGKKLEDKLRDELQKKLGDKFPFLPKQ